MQTELVDGYLCEWGADGFLDNAPDTLELVRDLGLRSGCCRAATRRGGASSSAAASCTRCRSRRGRSCRAACSRPGKARIAREPFARRRPEGDETIHDFAARRIGERGGHVMIDSMVSGIFAGDARALSLRACFPKMWQMETDHGGLFRAMLATRKRRKKDDAMGAPAGHLTSFVGGMAELIHGLAASLGPAVRTSSPVIELQRGRRAEGFGPAAGPSGYTVLTPHDRIEADAVVLTGPSSEAAALVRPFDSTLASLLAGIATAPLAVLCLGFDAGALARDRGELNGFGFLVPRQEKIRMLGALWESAIYPDRAPPARR